MAKKFKLISIALCIMAFVMSFSFCTYANEDADIIVSMQINNPVMEINGTDANIDEDRGTTPVIVKGRTLVPIRAIIEAFGGDVSWNGFTRRVTLTMGDDVIKLVINSTTAYLNNRAYTLDVAPDVINDRTMMPIRFIAEGFNLGVAWHDRTQTVTLVQNGFDSEEYSYLKSILPPYTGSPYAVINDNDPFFEDYEIINGSFEYYSNLDSLGRCDVCMASISESIMPTGERGSISSVKPTGWINNEYDFVDGGYLYNRCHLIGYQLTGENANERNLITGTRYMNVDAMLPFENMVDDYIESTGNSVMYRVTPVFTGNNLVADGVLMEAYSIEDEGRGVSFCVYCYNVQPLVKIDYKTGANTLSQDSQSPIVADTSQSESAGVYRTPGGKRYHFDAECGGKNSFSVSLADAVNEGLTPCTKCTQ